MVVDIATTFTGDTAGDPGLCLCDGTARVRVGDGGLQAFSPYTDGDALPLSVGPSGSHGVHLDLLSEGLDTSGSMNVILRVGVDGNDSIAEIQEEHLSLVRMQRPRPGPGWVQVFAALPEELQQAAAEGDLQGVGAHLTLSLVDKHRDEDTVRVDVVLC